MTSSEWKRKFVHMGMGVFALALRWLTWEQAALCALAALLFNLFAMPRIGRGIYRDPGKARDTGIVAYPAMVLLVVLLFRYKLDLAAAIWGMMALGDPMASIAGKHLRGPRLPWNRSKSWSGSVAHAIFGAIGGSLLMAYAGRYPWTDALRTFAGFALLGAFLESVETGFDDNVVPAAGVAIAFASLHWPSLAPAEGAFGVWGAQTTVLVSLGLNAAIALLTAVLGVVSLSGGIAGALFGSIVLRYGGWGAYAVVWTFFLAGTAASKVGYARKEKLGTAQANRGRRGARHVAANVGIGAWIAYSMSKSAGPGIPLVGACALAGSFAAALADTFGTEFGTLFGSRPFLLSRLKRVLPGTRGAVSWPGIFGGIVGAGLVGVVGAVWVRGASDSFALAKLVLVIAFAGTAGSIAESLLIDLSARCGISADHEFCNVFNTWVGAGVAGEIVTSLAMRRPYIPFSQLGGFLR
jgi:uncharacterized protein (TIGR00297 family)